MVKKIMLVVMACQLVSGVVLAADEPTARSNAVAIDTVWTLIATFLVFFMQAGFAMVEKDSPELRMHLKLSLKI